MTDPIRSAGKHPFDYQAPEPQQIIDIADLREEFKKLNDLIIVNVASSRERSLAITKMEEASMWLNKAIVFSEPRRFSEPA